MPAEPGRRHRDPSRPDPTPHSATGRPLRLSAAPADALSVPDGGSRLRDAATGPAVGRWNFSHDRVSPEGRFSGVLKCHRVSLARPAARLRERLHVR